MYPPWQKKGVLAKFDICLPPSCVKQPDLCQVLIFLSAIPKENCSPKRKIINTAGSGKKFSLRKSFEEMLSYFHGSARAFQFVTHCFNFVYGNDKNNCIASHVVILRGAVSCLQSAWCSMVKAVGGCGHTLQGGEGRNHPVVGVRVVGIARIEFFYNII
jgi:hypothetical protein